MNIDRNKLMHRLSRSRKLAYGIAAVELGLTIVPLLTLTFGMTEYSRMIFTYNALAKATRDAARHMTSTSVNRRAEAINLALYGTVAPTVGTTPLLAPDLLASNVVICSAGDEAGCPSEPHVVGGIDLVTVRISGYVYRSIITYVAPATLSFNQISTTMRSE